MTILKSTLAATVAVMALAATPLALANNLSTQPTTQFHLSPMNANTPDATAVPVSTIDPPSALPDSVPLRGHLTAIPKGTLMMVKLDRPLTSYSSKIGDAVEATLEADVYQDSQLIIPQGAQLEGAITGVTAAGHVGKAGAVEVQFQAIRAANGMTYPIRAHVVTDDNSGVIRGDSQQAQVLKTLGVAGGVTAAGTVGGLALGSILGSAGTGATFGLAAGALAGMGYAVVREGKQVVIPSGARMSIQLDEPVAVN